MFIRYRLTLVLKGGAERSYTGGDLHALLYRAMEGLPCLHACYVHIEEERLTWKGWRTQGLFTLGPTKDPLGMAWVFLSTAMEDFI